MKSIKKVISIFLAILTLFSICSVSTTVFAAEYTEQRARTEYFDSALSGYLKNIVDIEDAVSIAEKEQIDETIEEVQSSAVSMASTFSLRTASVQNVEETESVQDAVEDLDIDHTRLTLELEDGENVAYLFSEPVSFIDDEGNLVYKDTNIKAVTDGIILNRGYSFENGNNDYKAYFSEDSSKGLLLVEKDGEEIRLVPNGTQSVGTVKQIESDMELVDSFEYAGVYGTDSVLRFLPQLNGCKEEIVLSSYQGISDFSFTLYTEEGTIAAINSNGEVEIIDSATKDIITTFVAPFANDSSGGMDVTSEHYTDCTYELEMISEGKYILTISVPEEYLESEGTVYPVIIDPTTDNISMTYDTSVYSALKDSPQSSNPSACFGKTGSSQYGKGRAMFFFKIPSDIEKYAKISSAKLWLREVTGRTETMYVRPYLIKESWNNSVTWSTQPAHRSTFSYPGKEDLTLARRNINSKSTDNADNPYWYAFNITNAVRAWTTETANKGLKFIAECEASDGDYLWRAFATKENTTSSYRPYAVISYTNDTTKPTISKVTASPSGWTSGSVTLTVTAKDSGDYGIYRYSFNDGDGWRTTDNKTFSSNQTVYIRVKDHAGNISDRYTYIIDNQDPKVPTASISFSPTTPSSSNITATIKMTDESALAKYTLDGTTTTIDADGSEKIKSKTITKTYSSSGTCKIVVYDASGRSCTVSKSFTIDPKPPEATISLSNSNWTNQDVKATFTMTDNNALKSYSIDGATAVFTSGKEKIVEKTYTTKTTAKITVTDTVGLSKTVQQEVKIDKTAPTATVAGTINGDTVDVTVTASDTLSGLHSTAYSFNGGSWIAGKTATLSANATHTIKVRDKAGNIRTVTYNPKVGTVTASPSLDTWTNGTVTLTASGTNISQYNFDSGAWGTVKSKSYSANTTAKVGFKDSSGNITYINVTITNIDKENPVISAVNVTPEGEWTNQPITVTVNAKDDLSGISQYSFDGGVTWQEEATVTYTDNAPESVNIVVKDKAGNETYFDEIKKLPKPDPEIPTSPDLYEQDGLVYISSRSFDFNEDTDSAEYVEYSLDGTNWSSYEEPLNIVRTYGAKVYARVRDDAENISPIAEITLENNLGEYTASYTDIALGEGLFPVEFGRTYTSTNGWFFTFDANIDEIDENAYVFTDFYGEKHYFIKNSEGKYLSVDEEELTIVESTDEETGNKIKNYRLNYGDMIVELGNNCKLSRITTDYTTTEYKWNADGSLTIDGGAVVNFDKNFRPTSIVITRKENKDGVITDKTKTVVFTWENDKLMKFTDAMNGEHAYGYDEETGLLITNDTETIAYSDEGRVKKITQTNKSFVKYTYNDTAASTNTKTPKNIGSVTVSDSKGVTDTIPYSDGVYVSSSPDSYSDKAVYAPGEISVGITTDAISNIVYVVESEPQSEEQGTDEPSTGGEPESDGETATDNDIGEEANSDDPDTDGDISIDNEAVDTDEGTENSTESGGDNNVPSEPETPLYKAIDDVTYAFYTYDNQKRVTSELKVLKANITIDENTTFESAEAVSESKVTYAYVSDEDDSITVQTSYIKSQNGLAPDEKECYTYDRGNVLTHSKFKYIDGIETELYSESNEYNDYGNIITRTETQCATSVDAFDVTYTTTYTYDVWGMCTGTKVECNNIDDTTITEYDLNGVTLSVTYNDERVKYTYNDFGSVTTETVVKVNDDDTETFKYSTTYTYDEEKGNLLTCKNPDGDTSYYHYDTYGNLTWHTFNDYYFEYNTLGSIMNANVGAKVVEKDEINEKGETNVKYEIEDKGTEIVAYNYEGAEQELSYIDYKNGQRINYAYDEATGDLLTVSQGEDAKFSYSYSTVGKDVITTLNDDINKIIKVIENDKVTVKADDEEQTFIYSVENLYEDEETSGSFNGKKITVGTDVYTLKSEISKDSFYVGETGTEAFIKTYENDYAGNLWKVNTANAVSTQYGYNEDKNVSTLKNTLNGLVQTFGYGYDDEGNITTETLNIVTSDEVGATVETNQAVNYTYDANNQLKTADYGNVSYEYIYDNSDDETAEPDNRGNITKKIVTADGVAQTVEYVYDTQWKDKLISYNGQSISYDVVGNPVEYLGDKLTWTMGRQLAEYRNTNGTIEEDDDIIYSYTYNEDGIRTSKTVNNVTTTYYLDGTNIIEQITGDTVLHFHYDSNDEIIGFTYNEADYFYVKNAMSDIIGIVDDSGNLIASYVYDAWGKVLSVTGSNVELGNLNPFRYRSYYYDTETDFYYLQSRYYDPEVCRFVNSDDVNFIGATGTVGSYNAFAYCENEPASRVDYTGACYLNSDGKICHTNSCKDKYVPKNAINYAEKWWNKRNKDYYKYLRNGDCANFVSQCLYAGGKKMNDSWHSFWASFKPSKSRKDYDKWDYDYKKLPIRCYRVSNAWGTAKGLYKYLKKSYNLTTYKNVDKLEKAIKNKKIKVGDVAFLKNKEDGVHHAMIIGRVVNTKNKKDCYYYAHTTDRNANKNNSSVSNLLRDEEVIIFNIK